MSVGRFLRACVFGISWPGLASAKVCLLASEPGAVERVLAIESFAGQGRASWLSVETRSATELAWLVGNGDVLAIEPQGAKFLETLESETAPAVSIATGFECDRISARPSAGRVRIGARGAPLLGPERWSRELARFRSSAEDCELEEPVRVVLFDMPPDRPASTAVLRVAGERDLALRSNFDAFVTYLSFGAGRAHFQEATELAAHDLELTYFLAERRSDYTEARNRWLASVSGPASVLESVASLENTAAQSNAERLPLFAVYYRTSGLSNAATCLSLLGVSADVLAGEPFARACPLPRVPATGFPDLPECVEPTMEGTVDAATARCEHADDFALALSGLTLANARLTRSFVRLPARSERVPRFVPGGDVPRALTPARIDSSRCTPVAPPPIFEPAAPSAPPEPSPAGPAHHGPEYEGSYPTVTIYVEDDESCSGDSSSDGSCSGDSSSSSDDSCSGDSSSSSDDSCSGDSSASSEDDSCSGDSSASSDDDSCSGDSSASSEDDSCSGDSSSSDEDESCFGSTKPTSARPSARPMASIAKAKDRGRRHRSRLSVWTIALSAVWLPIRRLGRATRFPSRC